MPIYFTLKVRIIIPQIESESKISFETHSWHTKIFHNFFWLWTINHFLEVISPPFGSNQNTDCSKIQKVRFCFWGVFWKCTQWKNSFISSLLVLVQTIRFAYLYCTILPNFRTLNNKTFDLKLFSIKQILKISKTKDGLINLHKQNYHPRIGCNFFKK